MVSWYIVIDAGCFEERKDYTVYNLVVLPILYYYWPLEKKPSSADPLHSPIAYTKGNCNKPRCSLTPDSQTVI